MTFAAGGVMMAVLASPMAVPTAQAFGWADVLGGIIGVSSTYSYYLNSLSIWNSFEKILVVFAITIYMAPICI